MKYKKINETVWFYLQIGNTLFVRQSRKNRYGLVKNFSTSRKVTKHIDFLIQLLYFHQIKKQFFLLFIFGKNAASFSIGSKCVKTVWSFQTLNILQILQHFTKFKYLNNKKISLKKSFKKGFLLVSINKSRAKPFNS